MKLSSQTPGKFSCAKTVMDKEDGWNEDGWAMNDGEQDGRELVGSWRRAMWIYTKAVMCNGQRNMDKFRHQKKELHDRGNQLVVQHGTVKQ